MLDDDSEPRILLFMRSFLLPTTETPALSEVPFSAKVNGKGQVILTTKDSD